MERQENFENSETFAQSVLMELTMLSQLFQDVFLVLLDSTVTILLVVRLIPFVQLDTIAQLELQEQSIKSNVQLERTAQRPNYQHLHSVHHVTQESIV